jgi:outer membrane protein OmpA-like peptidoglycan-associated protein
MEAEQGTGEVKQRSTEEGRKTQTGGEAEQWEALFMEINAQLEAYHIRPALAAEVNAQLGTRYRGDAAAGSAAITLPVILFPEDSAVLTDSAKRRLDGIAQLLSELPRGMKILVTGYTALAGGETGREKISIERARTVADYLVQAGGRMPGEIMARGYGAESPAADNNTPIGRALNRRAEIAVLEE